MKEKIFKELQKKRFGDDISAAEEELNKNVQDKFKLLRKRNQANIEVNYFMCEAFLNERFYLGELKKSNRRAILSQADRSRHHRSKISGECD